MTTNITTFILLIISLIFCVTLLFVILKKINKSQLRSCFIGILTCILICLIFLALQCTLGNTFNFPLIYYDYIVYIGACLLPPTLYITSRVFANTKIKITTSYLALFIIPFISLFILWTNDFHHLFYKTYSINLNQAIAGPYLMIHNIYSYCLLFIGLFLLIKYSIKNAGFFSKQSLLLVLGSLIPLIVNILGTFNIIPMTVYITPICFAFTILFFAIAIFKFNFLSSTPIALQRIVDRISDGYLILDENDNITDFNQTLLNMFKLNGNDIRGNNLFDLLDKKSYFTINRENLKQRIQKVRNSDETLHFEKKLHTQEKYFNIEINSIRNNNSFLGTLILFKDTTQHILDMQTIQNNQNMLMERERLASLGQLIGGIAHNLKTPIMSIAGASEGLTDLIKEYESSVGDPEVTVQDHHDIAKDMTEWVQKIRDYTEYMSDVITAVKGQAVTMSDEQAVTFTIDELVKRVNILMRHELKNALVTLNVSNSVKESTALKGNINSLIQVINNMISNAIQAYNGAPDKEIDLILQEKDNNVIISIKDYGTGLPEKVQQKLFKEMITTKGKNGTGLGLFMSYSTIRAHFNGNITFETAEGKGTVFHIILPV